MMISGYQMGVGDRTQFDAPLHSVDLDNSAVMLDVEDFEAPAAHTPDQRASRPEADDSVRRYLREIGSVPLLTRSQEVDLARRIERGKSRRDKAISRSGLVQQR